MGKKSTDEPQELINFCLDKCTESDCDGTDGCYAYQVERARLLGLPEPEKPKRGPYKRKELPAPEVILIENAPASISIMPVPVERKDLALINAAIEALDRALEVIPNSKWVPSFIDAPEQLRKYRSTEYAHLVDWNAIAGGGLTPSARGGV